MIENKENKSYNHQEKYPKLVNNLQIQMDELKSILISKDNNPNIFEITFHDDNNKINAQLNSDDEKQNKVQAKGNIIQLQKMALSLEEKFQYIQIIEDLNLRLQNIPQIMKTQNQSEQNKHIIVLMENIIKLTNQLQFYIKENISLKQKNLEIINEQFQWTQKNYSKDETISLLQKRLNILAERVLQNSKRNQIEMVQQQLQEQIAINQDQSTKLFETLKEINQKDLIIQELKTQKLPGKDNNNNSANIEEPKLQKQTRIEEKKQKKIDKIIIDFEDNDEKINQQTAKNTSNIISPTFQNQQKNKPYNIVPFDKSRQILQQKIGLLSKVNQNPSLDKKDYNNQIEKKIISPKNQVNNKQIEESKKQQNLNQKNIITKNDTPNIELNNKQIEENKKQQNLNQKNITSKNETPNIQQVEENKKQQQSLNQKNQTLPSIINIDDILVYDNKQFIQYYNDMWIILENTKNQIEIDKIKLQQKKIQWCTGADNLLKQPKIDIKELKTTISEQKKLNINKNLDICKQLFNLIDRYAKREQNIQLLQNYTQIPYISDEPIFKSMIRAQKQKIQYENAINMYKDLKEIDSKFDSQLNEQSLQSINNNIKISADVFQKLKQFIISVDLQSITENKKNEIESFILKQTENIIKTPFHNDDIAQIYLAFIFQFKCQCIISKLQQGDIKEWKELKDCGQSFYDEKSLNYLKIVNQQLEFYEECIQFEKDHNNKTIVHIKELLQKSKNQFINISQIQEYENLIQIIDQKISFLYDPTQQIPIEQWKILKLDKELINISQKFKFQEYEYICNTITKAENYINDIKLIKNTTDDVGSLFEKKQSLLLKYVKENFLIEDLEKQLYNHNIAKNLQHQEERVENFYHIISAFHPDLKNKELNQFLVQIRTDFQIQQQKQQEIQKKLLLQKKSTNKGDITEQKQKNISNQKSNERPLKRKAQTLLDQKKVENNQKNKSKKIKQSIEMEIMQELDQMEEKIVISQEFEQKQKSPKKEIIKNKKQPKQSNYILFQKQEVQTKIEDINSQKQDEYQIIKQTRTSKRQADLIQNSSSEASIPTGKRKPKIVYTMEDKMRDIWIQQQIKKVEKQKDRELKAEYNQTASLFKEQNQQISKKSKLNPKVNQEKNLLEQQHDYDDMSEEQIQNKKQLNI